VPASASVQNDFVIIKLSSPFTEEKIRALKAGGEVLISGIVFTGAMLDVNGILRSGFTDAVTHE